MLSRFFGWLKLLFFKPAVKDPVVELTRIAKSGIPTGVTFDPKSLTFKITDVGAYFGNWDEFERESEERRMRAERTQALTISRDGASASEAAGGVGR